MSPMFVIQKQHMLTASTVMAYAIDHNDTNVGLSKERGTRLSQLPSEARKKDAMYPQLEAQLKVCKRQRHDWSVWTLIRITRPCTIVEEIRVVVHFV